MKRRRFIQTIGACGLAAANPAFGADRGGGRKKRSPNIIVIMADDLGYGDLSYYGSKRNRTPNLDALAAGGVRFTDFHSSCPVCSPTRAGLVTGRYQQRCGIPEVLTVKRHRDQGLASTETTFAKAFKSAGYATGLFGKWHLGYRPQFNPVKHGFDEFRGYLSGNVDYISHIDQAGVYDWWHNTESVEEEGYTTHLITQHAVQFIEDHQTKPFCLYVAHEAPHYPYQGPDDPADRTVGGKFSTHGSRKDIVNAYRTMVEEMDLGVGQIVKKLRELHLEQETLIFFLSDNGATKAGSNGELRGYKGSLWEGGHRVPAFACWPGTIAPGRICHSPAISLDVFPTIASATDVGIPTSLKLDGADLMPELLADKGIPKRTLFWAFKTQKAVRKGSWKLVVTMKQNKDSIELFDLSKDLGEKNNLAEKRPQLVRTLLDELRDWEKDVS